MYMFSNIKTLNNGEGGMPLAKIVNRKTTLVQPHDPGSHLVIQMTKHDDFSETTAINVCIYI